MENLLSVDVVDMMKLLLSKILTIHMETIALENQQNKISKFILYLLIKLSFVQFHFHQIADIRNFLYLVLSIWL